MARDKWPGIKGDDPVCSQLFKVGAILSGAFFAQKKAPVPERLQSTEADYLTNVKRLMVRNLP